MPELEERCGERREWRCSGLDDGGGARSDLSGCEWDLDLCKGKKSKENKTRGHESVCELLWLSQQSQS